MTVKYLTEKCCIKTAANLLCDTQVDTLLIELSDYTKEDDQVKCLTKIAKR